MADARGVLAAVLLLAAALPVTPVTKAQDGGQADLVLKEILIEPAEPDRGQEVTVKARIADEGDTSYSDDYAVFFTVDGRSLGEAQGNALDFIGADEVTKEAPDPWEPSAGPHVLVVQINTTDADGNASNNVGSRSITLGPDLAPTSVSATPASPDEGEEVSFDVEIENAGNWDSNATAEVELAVGDTTLTGQVDAIAPGETGAVTLGPWTAQPGTHDVSVTVDPAGELNESDTTNNTLAGDPIEVTETHPDLRIVHIVTQPVNPGPGDTVTIQASVRNTGDEPAPPSQTRLTINGTPHGELKQIDALDPDEQAPALWQWTGTLGVHTLGAVADAQGDVDEADEQDNEHNRTLTVGPDLVLKALRLDPQDPIEGDNVTVEVDVVNAGQSVQGNVTVALVIDGSPAASQVLDGFSANATETLTFGPFNATSGEHTVTAIVDPDGDIEEADPDNNEASARLDVGRSRPDLTVATAALEQRALAPGETARFTADVANDGGEPAPETTVRFAVDGETVGQPIEVGALDPGQATNVTSGNWTAQAGGHTLTVTVDPGADGGQIDEENEADNRFRLTFAVGPDLSPTALSLDPETPRLGENTTLTARIANLGTQAAGVFQVRFSVGDETIDDVTADGVGPRDEITVETAWRAGDADRIEVNVDVRDDVDEVDEQNNRARANISVNTSVPNLQAEALSADPARPAPGDNVTFELNVTNDGDSPAGTFQVAFSVNGTEVSRTSVGGLAAQETTSVTSEPWSATLGATNVTARIDPDGRLHETVTADNVATLRIHVDAQESGIPAPGAIVALFVTAMAALARARTRSR